MAPKRRKNGCNGTSQKKKRQQTKNSFVDYRSKFNLFQLSKRYFPFSPKKGIDYPPPDYQRSRYEIRQREVAEFLHRVTQHTPLELNPKTTDGTRNLNILYPLLSQIRDNELEDNPNDQSIIMTSRNGQYMCNVLLTAGIAEFKARKNVLVGTTLSEFYLASIKDSNQYNSISADFLSKDKFDALLESLTSCLKTNLSVIDTVVIPMRVGGNHWGLLVAIVDNVAQSKTIWWGDSLNRSSPSNLMGFFQAAVDNLLELEGNWSEKQENFMIDYLGFEIQHDSHSCGAYVMSTLHYFSNSSRCMPLPVFSTSDSSLTEEYRWSAVECFLNGALYLSFAGSTPDVISESHILSYLVKNRYPRKPLPECIKLGNTDIEASGSIAKYPSRMISTVEDDVLHCNRIEVKIWLQSVLEETFHKATSNLRVIYSTQQDEGKKSNTKQKVILEEDLYPSVSYFLRAMDTPSNLKHKTETEEIEETAGEECSVKDLVSIVNSSEEPILFANFIGYVAQLSGLGYNYTLHNYRKASDGNAE